MNIVPIEQATATLLAGIIIPEGQGGNAVNIVKRANSALAAAAAINSVSSGDAAGGLAAITTALNNSNLDPAVVLALQNLLVLGLQQVSLAKSIASVIPILGVTATAVLGNLAAGITAAANAEIAKYGTAAAVATPAPAPAA